MAKHALIVQPDHDPLPSFPNSAACMEQLLRARGFAIERCDGARATRTGILAAYDQLIRDARDDDAVVVYYTGHGGLTTNSTYAPDAGLPRVIQNICPSDYAATADDDFRGISTFELSLQLAALTRKTLNATVIFECCYAAQLARGSEPATAPAPPRLTRAGLTRHLEALRERSREFEQLEITGNPYAVRVAAAGQMQGAYSLQLPSARELHALGLDLPARGLIGGMTLRLAEILGQIGDARVAWRTIAAELRSRLIVQRPEIEGPVGRVPFSLAIVDTPAFSVRSDGDTAILEAGRLAGVTVGDVYAVMPAGATQIEPDEQICELTVHEVSATQSRARYPGAARLPASAVAIAVASAFERAAVRVVACETSQPMIEAVLEDSRRVRAATPDDRDVIAELHVRGDELVLRDALGPLFPPARYPECLCDAVRDLESLAAEHRLRALPSSRISAAEVSVELFSVGVRGYRALHDHGEALGLRDRIALQLVNRTAAPLYANVFNVGLRKRIKLLSAFAASGIKLEPRTPVYVGDTITGGVVGMKLGWLAGLPRDQPRTDTIMVIVTDAPADLRLLETGEHLGEARELVPLQAVMAQIATGARRGASPTSAGSAFAICWRDYWLFPIDASLDCGIPQINASPAGSPPPPAVAAKLRIRLRALAVAAGTRVDVLVCARSTQAPYRATTVTAATGDIEVWSGELRGPAEIFVWTSTEDHDHRTLSDLLNQRPTGDAVAVLCSPDGDPSAALVPGASLALAALARTALAETAVEVVTAFRGSFGSEEVGAPRFAAENVSFAVVIERLG